MKTTTVSWAVGALILISAGGNVSVAQNATAQSDSQYEAALDSVLADIADPERSMEFVKAATAAGDLRGAVAALERMLLLNPELANIQLELGVLYLRLGNESLGRYHMTQALKAPNVPTVVRERAEALLASAAGQSGSGRRSTLRGQLALNAHYDNNANAAPSSPNVLGHDPFSGQDIIFELSRQSLKQSDSSADLNVGVTHSLLLGASQNVLETNALVYASKFDDFSNLDFTVGSLDLGPVLRLGGRDDTPISLRPYASVTYDLLDGSHYLSAYGAGLELRAQASALTYGYGKLEYSKQDFYDNSKLFVSDRSGKYTSLDVGVVHQLGRSLQLSANLAGAKADADTDYQTYDRYGGGLGAKFFFGYGRGLPPWAIGLFTQVRRSEYDQPDPQINSSISRHDTRYDVGLTLDVPITRSVLLSVRGNYTDNHSNIPNYAFDNTGGSIGTSWRF